MSCYRYLNWSRPVETTWANKVQFTRKGRILWITRNY